MVMSFMVLFILNLLSHVGGPGRSPDKGISFAMPDLPIQGIILGFLNQEYRFHPLPRGRETLMQNLRDSAMQGGGLPGDVHPGMILPS
jgi:hypothetical protein